MNSSELIDRKGSQRQRYLRIGGISLLLFMVVIGGGLILSFDDLVFAQDAVALEVGQVAPLDILAPRSLQYESEELTEAKRAAAVVAVRPVYDPPDTSVASEQLQLARQILDYIDNVRHDDFASDEDHVQDLMAITAVTLDAQVIDLIMSISSDERWTAVDAQVTRLLERVMGTEVRDDNIQAKRDSISNLISSSYSESEVQIIETLVAGLVRPNTFYNEELTRQAEDQAAQSVVAEIRSFAQGQMIIRAGEIASSADIEALDKFGLLEASDRQENLLVGSFVIMGMATLMLGLYSWQFNPAVYEDPPLLVLLCVVFLVFLAAAQLIGADGAVRQYYFPASAMVFLVATIVDKQLAIVMGISLAALVGFMADDSLEFASVIGLSGSIGVLALGRTERLNSYFFAGGVVGLANIVVAILFALTGTESNNYFILASQILGGIVNGGFSAALALVGLYLVTNLMNIPTSLKIVELMQPNHPLLVRLLREAPGTYQHSLQVANLAELGGQQINANASLLRVAAMYHDIGKILNPHFFVENQADGVNPHDALGDPSQSARIIIGHVTEGDRLARRHRLPTRIREFITEHHGTTQVVYFYRQALSAAENDEGVVDIREFTYPGPRPQTRETAILMLADGCESSVRSRRPQSKHDIQETVDYIFDTRLREGQLDESGLTLNDLHTLRDTFLTALQGIFHPRIAYPGSPGEKSNALPPGNASTLPEKASSSAASVAVGKNAEDDGTGSSEEGAKPAGTKSSDREAASLPQEPLA